jgi:hypothetical protein
MVQPSGEIMMPWHLRRQGLGIAFLLSPHGPFAYPHIRRQPWPVKPPVMAQYTATYSKASCSFWCAFVLSWARTRMAFVIYAHVIAAVGLSAELDFDISRCRYEGRPRVS